MGLVKCSLKATKTLKYLLKVSPWGGNPPVSQSRFDAQTYVQYGLTDSLTVFGQTAFEHYALGQPTPDTYDGLDYSDIGLRAKLWSTGDWVFSGEAAAFISGAHDAKAPAEEGNTGWAGEARLNAGTNFKAGSTPGFIDAELGYRLRTQGPPNEWHGDLTVRFQVHPAAHADAAGLHDGLGRLDRPDVPGVAPVGGRGKRGLRARRQLVGAGRPVLDRVDGQDQHPARRRACGVAEFLTEPFRSHALFSNSSRPISMRRISLVPAPIS
jgi:hypothetical protein